jgi:hypothetical protein
VVYMFLVLTLNLHIWASKLVDSFYVLLTAHLDIWV